VAVEVDEYAVAKWLAKSGRDEVLDPYRCHPDPATPIPSHTEDPALVADTLGQLGPAGDDVDRRIDRPAVRALLLDA